MNNLLYIAWQPEEVFFHLGPIPVRWYGMCWLIGLALGYFMMQWLYKRHKYPAEKFEPLFLYVFIGVLAGARLGKNGRCGDGERCRCDAGTLPRAAAGAGQRGFRACTCIGDGVSSA